VQQPRLDELSSDRLRSPVHARHRRWESAACCMHDWRRTYTCRAILTLLIDLARMQPVRAATCTCSTAGARSPRGAALACAGRPARGAYIYICGPRDRSASPLHEHAHLSIHRPRRPIDQHVDDEESGDAGGRPPAAAHRRCTYVMHTA